MDRIVNILIAIAFIMATAWTAESVLYQIKTSALTKIERGLSSSEEFAQQLTDMKLPF